MTDVPMVTRPVTGYRRWVMRARRLWPVFRMKDPWVPGENVAGCTPEFLLPLMGEQAGQVCCLHPPGPDCECGLYAYHKPTLTAFNTSDTIEGAVVGIGTMEVYSDGWRAERARIVALLSPTPEPSKAVRKIARYYEVPLAFSRKALVEEAMRHGAPLSKDLVPEAQDPAYGSINVQTSMGSWQISLAPSTGQVNHRFVIDPLASWTNTQTWHIGHAFVQDLDDRPDEQELS